MYLLSRRTKVFKKKIDLARTIIRKCRWRKEAQILQTLRLSTLMSSQQRRKKHHRKIRQSWLYFIKIVKREVQFIAQSMRTTTSFLTKPSRKPFRNSPTKKTRWDFLRTFRINSPSGKEKKLALKSSTRVCILRWSMTTGETTWKIWRKRWCTTVVSETIISQPKNLKRKRRSY